MVISDPRHTDYDVQHDTHYAHLASVRFEHSVCRESLMTTYIMLLA